MLLTNRGIIRAIISVSGLARNAIEAGFTQAGEIALCAKQQIMVAHLRTESERWCHRILLSQIGAHATDIGFLTSMGLLIRTEISVVGRFAAVMYVGNRQIEPRIPAHGQRIREFGRETLRVDVLRHFGKGVQILVVGHDTAPAFLVGSLATEDEFIVLCERIVEV